MVETPPVQQSSPPPGSVMVGVDGSDHDLTVVTAGVAHASRHGAPLHLRHCRELVNPYAFGAPVIGEWAEALDSSDDLLATRVAHARGLGAEATADAPLGPPENSLVDGSASATCVVVGTGRKSSVAELALGAVALNVAAHAQCPVLVVPQGTDAERTGDVVVGVDGSAHSRAAVTHGLAEARVRGVRLVVVTTWDVQVVGGYVVTEPESPEWRQIEEELGSMQRGLLDQLDSTGVQVVHQVVHGKITTALAQLSEQASLVVVGNRGRGGFKSKALGSVTMNLLKRTTSPVLVVHA